MQEWLEDRLQKLPDLHIQRMFGGAGIYSEDTMFGILDDGRIYLKTDAVTRLAFSECGMGPFRPQQDVVLKSYYEVPPEILEDDEAILSWARRAISVAQAAPAKPKSRVKANAGPSSSKR